MSLVGFSEKDAARIAETVRTVERMPGNTAGVARRRNNTPIPRFNLRGKLDGNLNAGGSATMSVWYHDGAAEVDTGEDITVYDWLLDSGEKLTSGRKVVASFFPDSGRYYVTADHWPEGVLFLNEESEPIPPYAVMFASGATWSAGTRYVLAKKPTAYVDNVYLVNGPDAVAVGEFGRGSWLSEGGPVAYEGSLAAGNECGAKPGSWKLNKGYPGFLCLGAFGTDNGVATCGAKQQGVWDLMGKIYGGDLSPGGTAQMKVCLKLEGAWTQTTQTVTVEDFFMNTGDKIKENTKVRAKFYSAGWIVDGAYCSVSNRSP